MKRLLILLVTIISVVSTVAQTQDSESIIATTMDLSLVATADSILGENAEQYNPNGIKIPPLSVFLEAAKDYADVKFYDEKISEEELLYRQSKKEWLKYIRLQGNYQYGKNAMIQQTDAPIENPNIITLQNQTWYNAGVVVSVPLDDLFNRHDKNKTSRSKINQARLESEKALENRQLIILQTYNEVIKHLSILKVKAEAVALYEAQMRISERDFALGKIDIITLSLERSRRSNANVSYQESRAALHNAATLLEMLTKIKILNQ